MRLEEVYFLCSMGSTTSWYVPMSLLPGALAGIVTFKHFILLMLLLDMMFLIFTLVLMRFFVPFDTHVHPVTVADFFCFSSCFC